MIIVEDPEWAFWGLGSFRWADLGAGCRGLAVRLTSQRSCLLVFLQSPTHPAPSTQPRLAFCQVRKLMAASLTSTT